MGRRRVGPTVFAQVESEASYYFAGPEQLVMINFLVRYLNGMVARLRTAGADVDGEIEPWKGPAAARG